MHRKGFACAAAGLALLLNIAAARSQSLVPECDVWLREAEACLRDTGQRTSVKQEALREARAHLTALSGGEDVAGGPRERLAARCRAMRMELAEQRAAGSRACTI